VQVAQVNLDDRKIDLRFLSSEEDGDSETTAETKPEGAETSADESEESKPKKRKRSYRKKRGGRGRGGKKKTGS
jgi:ribonuclease R